MRRSFFAATAVLSLIAPACVTEQTHFEQISLSIPDGAARLVLLGTGGTPFAIDPRGLPRDPASLVLVPDGGAPIVIDPWAGSQARITGLLQARPRGPGDVATTPNHVLLTSGTAEAVAGLLEMAANQPSSELSEPITDSAPESAPENDSRPRLIVTQAILDRLLVLDQTAVDGYQVIVPDAGGPVNLGGGIAATSIELDDGNVAFRVQGPQRTVLYMPKGELPASAAALDRLILGVDAAILDGSGVGRGQDPLGVLDRCIRWGVPKGNVQFTSISLEEPGFPAEAIEIGGAIAEDGFEIWL